MDRPRRRLILWLLALWGAVLVVLALPLPSAGTPWIAPTVQGIVALFLVCWMGKLLYDTLFIDRGRP